MPGVNEALQALKVADGYNNVTAALLAMTSTTPDSMATYDPANLHWNMGLTKKAVDNT